MRVHLTCAQCGAAYAVKPSKAHRGETSYCSRTCYSAARVAAKIPLAESTCHQCGVPFTLAAWRLLKGEGQFCSRACRDQGAHLARTDPTKRQTKPCAVCGESFTAWASLGRQYCSNTCRGRATVGNIERWRATGFETTCEQCGVTYRTTPKQTRGRFCSRRCFGLWLGDGNAPTGADSATWRGGYLPYYGGSWRRARRLARERDGRCMDCGVTPAQNGKALDVHHLIPFRTFGRERHHEANALSNLVALCQVCHQKREWASNRRDHG